MATDPSVGRGDDFADRSDLLDRDVTSEVSNAQASAAATVPEATERGSWLADGARRRTMAMALIAAELMVLTLVVALVRRDGIEKELQKSVSEAISIDTPGLQVSVEGRDVTIRGATLSPDAKEKIAGIARKRRGVRTVNVDGLGTVSELDPTNTGTVAGGEPTPTTAKLPVLAPKVSAVFDATSITLRGEVPSAEARDALIGRLKERTSGATLSDQLTIAKKPVEVADLAQYRRVGTFLDTMARLPVLSANVDFDRTILTVTADVADEAGRDLLRRESVVLVGGSPDRVRGEFTVGGSSSSSSVASDTTSVTGETTTTVASGPVTVPPLPNTPEAQAAQTAITTAIDGRTIEFRKSSSALSDAGNEVVLAAANALKTNAAKVEVGGHTDAKGRAEMNQELSQERADAVRTALIAAGVDATRITAKGYGEDVPVATNNSESGRAKNRRIEIRVVG